MALLYPTEVALHSAAWAAAKPDPWISIDPGVKCFLTAMLEQMRMHWRVWDKQQSKLAAATSAVPQLHDSAIEVHHSMWQKDQYVCAIKIKLHSTCIS